VRHRREIDVADERRQTTRGSAASLRTAALLAAVTDVAAAGLEALGRPLRVLDLGGGTGGLAVPLAELGHDITVVDPSPDALAALERRAAESGVADHITARQGDADSLAEVRPADGFDLVCCHGVLEVVDDPASALAAVAVALAPDGHLSLLVAGRLAVVLAKALAGEFGQAREALTSTDGRWGRTDPLPRRFDIAQLESLLHEAGLTSEHVHGIRLFSDLVPSGSIDSATDRATLLELEQAVADHPAYAFLGGLGAGIHVLARRV
jgi:S-adenosylmethionine-dependent methyltransferase